ncbi:carbohydrate ABC transporter permease [Neglectibacter caecimuris]|uniref:carbohydrate ABC transporter permease n=1 Tax=Neglectibacter caecimuris TaxID=3093658 RepID=UPI002AC8FE4C|nr:carbohydrate ABC transporter permease [Neglectibacter sp. M00184]
MTTIKRKFSLPNFFIGLFILIFALFCLLPMILTFMVSITDESTILRNGYSFFPQKFSTEAYELMFRGASILHGYLISIAVTVVGTLGAILITGLAAYTLANKNVKYRNVLGMYFFIPMVFGAGIVPWYLICNMLHLRDNIFALIVPNLLFNTFNLFLVRNFMSGLPDSLRESATIDGANDAVIAFRIYFPLTVPALATVGLFYGLNYWNDWWNAIMLVDDKNLYPIQYFLLQLKSQVTMIKDLQRMTGIAGGTTAPTESLKMATAIVTVGPIVLLYPFLQKYYVKGLVVGSVKG